MYDANVVDKLISIEKKMLFSFVKLNSYKRDSKLFYKEFYFLRDVLLKKEEILISKLPLNISFLNDILDDVIDNKSNLFDNECMCYFVLERIRSIICDLIITLEEDTYCDDDCITLSSSKTRKIIDDNSSFQFLDTVSELLKNNSDLKDMLEITKYYEAFISKNVSDVLINNEFDFERLSFLKDSEMCIRLDMSFDDYSIVKDDEICNCLEDLTCSLLDVFNRGDMSFTLSYMLFKFKFLIHDISDNQLLAFKDYFYNIISPVKDDSFIDSFVFSFDFELKRRGLNNSACGFKLDEATLSHLIKLIKTSGKIYELCKLDDINNPSDKTLSCLKSCISLEKYLITKIDVNFKNESVIKSIIENDMSFFLSFDAEELKLVSRRIFNIIPYFYNLNVSPTQSLGSYDYIHKNHIIRSLKKYLQVLDSKDDYYQYLKEIMYVHDFLTFDFMVTGNYMMIEDLSDSLVCQILDIKRSEYSFDKDEQLLERADDIISDIYDDNTESHVFFSILELEDIMETVSTDCLFKLKNEVIHSEFYSKKIVKEIEKVRKKIG